jgi:dolichol-phosphate mannosyltransferase
MARVSLILPLATDGSVTAERIEAYCRSLRDAGHAVEDVQVVVDPRSTTSPPPGASWALVRSEVPGLAGAAVAGLRGGRGDLLAIVDPARGYSPGDLVRLIEPLAAHEAELGLASRRAYESRGGLGGPRAWAAAFARRVIGATDPFSGLVALNRSTAREAEFAPVGSWFALELLVRTRGRRVEVTVPRDTAEGRGSIRFDDLRHVKKLADHRFGNVSRLFQFCLVGASGMVVDLSFYALFQWLFAATALTVMTAPLVGGSLALAAARAVAILIALSWNFSLNRRLTFSYARHGSIFRQYVAYALSNTLGIAVSFTLGLVLPGWLPFFHRHKLAAAAVGIVAATGISFSMSRWFVFSRQQAKPAKRLERASRRAASVPSA